MVSIDEIKTKKKKKKIGRLPRVVNSILLSAAL